MQRISRLPLLLRVALVCLTLGCLAPVCTCDFINFDDPLYVTDNPHVQEGLTANSLRWAWSDFHCGMYAPLTRTSFLLDYQIHGLKPMGYHLTNLLLHLANVLLLFEVLRAMTGSVWRCFLVAACFAIHPQHVESVAWITERKDVLSTLFGLLSLTLWVRYTRAPGRWRLLAVLGAYALSLCAKPMFVTFPFVLLLLDRWPLRRSETIGWSRLCWEKAPLFLLAAASCIVTANVHTNIGATACLGRLSLGYRLANAVVSYVAYLGQTVWPSRLAIYYPHPVERLPVWKIAGSAAVLAAMTLLVIVRRRRSPWLLTGWLWFLGTLTPVLGLVAMGGYARADRYTYVPHIGLFLGLVCCLDARWVSSARGRVVTAAAAVAVLAGLGVLTWKQVQTWKNSQAVWENALRVTHDNFTAHANLGEALHKVHVDAAIEQYQAALRLHPQYLLALKNLAAIYVEKEQFATAEPLLQRAVQVSPPDADLHFLLGVALEKCSRWQEAEGNLIEAVKLTPENAEMHLELGSVLERLQRLDEAEEQFRQTLALNPSSAEGHCHLGALRERAGRIEEAVEHFREAVRLDPDLAVANAHLGVQCEKEGELDEAARYLQTALRGMPADAETHCNLGVVLERQGKLAEAERELRQAIHLPGPAAATHVNLGIVLERQGKRETAIACYREAVRLAPGFVEAHCSLATVLAEQGNLEEAAREFTEAARLDPGWAVQAIQKAWVLAAHPVARLRNPAEALRLAHQVWWAGGQNNLVCLDVLAAAQAANGEYREAIKSAERALELARRSGRTEVAEQIGARLAQYRSASPSQKAKGKSEEKQD